MVKKTKKIAQSSHSEKKCECSGELNPIKVGMTLGIFCAGYLLFLVILASITGLGLTLVNIISSFCKGYGLSVKGAILGIIWGFLKGFVSGYLFTWLYHRVSKCSCCK